MKLFINYNNDLTGLKYVAPDFLTNVGLSRQGRRVAFNINQTTSQMNVSLKTLFAKTIPSGYRPVWAKLGPFICYNTGDSKFYNGYIRISEAGGISASVTLSTGGQTAVSDGGTYYIWACNMTWDTQDTYPS